MKANINRVNQEHYDTLLKRENFLDLTEEIHIKLED